MKNSSLFLNMVGSKCSDCGAGRLSVDHVTHDMASLFGMESVKVNNLPVLVCSRCKHLTITGPVIDGISMLLAATILGTTELGWMEIKYLRKLIGDTQDEFAQKLNVDRVTVSRWENSKVPITGITSEAIRLHAYLRLRGRSPAIDAVGAALTAVKQQNAHKRAKRSSYKLDGSRVVPAMAA